MVIAQDANHALSRLVLDRTDEDSVGSLGAHEAYLHQEEEEMGGAVAQASNMKSTADYAAGAFNEFTKMFVDFFSAVCRDTHELRHLSRDLFQKYIQPALHGEVSFSDYRRLYQEARQLLRSSLRHVYSRHGALICSNSETFQSPSAIAAYRMPYSARRVLLAGYLAARSPARIQSAAFSGAKHIMGSRRGKRPTATNVSQFCTVERLFAVIKALQPEEEILGIEMLIQLAGLTRTQLLHRSSHDDILDGIRVRCDILFEMADAVAASVKFDLRAYRNAEHR